MLNGGQLTNFLSFLRFILSDRGKHVLDIIISPSTSSLGSLTVEWRFEHYMSIIEFTLYELFIPLLLSMSQDFVWGICSANDFLGVGIQASVLTDWEEISKFPKTLMHFDRPLILGDPLLSDISWGLKNVRVSLLVWLLLVLGVKDLLDRKGVPKVLEESVWPCTTLAGFFIGEQNAIFSNKVITNV